MGYFPNGTAGDFYEAEYCSKCAHQPRKDDEPGCPVMLAHILYAYELCNDKDHPGKVILDLLIPQTKDDIGNKRCAMFMRRDGISDRQLKDWARYKAAMAEASA